MKKIILGLSITAASLLAGDNMLADGATGVKVGTLGIGIEYAVKVNEKLDLRLGVNKYDYSASGIESGVNYDIDLNLQTIAAIADYHAFDNGFVLSAGLMYNDNNLDFNANSGTHTVGDTSYTTAIKGEVTFNKIAPYVGLGYSNVTKSAGWGFSTELGALYQGKAKVDLTTTGGGVTTADIEKEENQLEDELSGYKWYPVLSVAVSYKF